VSGTIMGDGCVRKSAYVAVGSRLTSLDRGNRDAAGKELSHTVRVGRRRHKALNDGTTSGP